MYLIAGLSMYLFPSVLYLLERLNALTTEMVAFALFQRFMALVLHSLVVLGTTRSGLPLMRLRASTRLPDRKNVMNEGGFLQQL